MKQETVELYHAEELTALSKKQKLWRTAAIIIALITLALCITFCVLTEKNNTARMLISAIITSTVGGWIVITIVHFAMADIKAAEKHIKAVLEGEREAVDGHFTLTDERVRIIKGVSMQKVDVEGADRIPSLQLYSGKVKAFPKELRGRVYAVHGFIAAYEVNDDVV